MRPALCCQHRARQRLRLGTRPALLAQAKGNLFFHGGKDDLVVRVLEQKAKAADHRLAVPRRIDAVQPHLPGGGPHEARHQPQKAGLARPVATDNTDAAFCQMCRQPR